VFFMYINTKGIVLREVKYKESSKILTVLTDSVGKLTVSAHGAFRKNSRLAAATQLLVFSDMTLLQKKDRWTLTETQTIEQFIGLRDDLPLLSLGAYIAELTEAVSDEDSPNVELLPLCLNALYALSEKLKPPELVKPAFELRLMQVSGFEPVLRNGGGFEKAQVEDGVLALSEGAFGAAQYILSCDAKKLFSFRISDAALRELSTKTEGFVLTHLDRTFKTLDYYKKVLTFF